MPQQRIQASQATLKIASTVLIVFGFLSPHPAGIVAIVAGFVGRRHCNSPDPGTMRHYSNMCTAVLVLEAMLNCYPSRMISQRFMRVYHPSVKTR